MNPVIEAIKSRKSVRQFEEKTIQSDIKEAILEAAFQAPTAGNQMLYTIIDVTDQNL
jgi:nitroreductase